MALNPPDTPAKAAAKPADKKEMPMKARGATKKMASGGLAAGHKTADGVAKQGKTIGTMIKMKSGGKTC